MRNAIIAAIAAFGIAFSTSSASAYTCSEQAAICIQKNGPPQKCRATIARCNQTGIYVGSNGGSWPATRIQVGPRKRNATSERKRS
jgi:hypothetical protein